MGGLVSAIRNLALAGVSAARAGAEEGAEKGAEAVSKVAEKGKEAAKKAADEAKMQVEDAARDQGQNQADEEKKKADKAKIKTDDEKKAADAKKVADDARKAADDAKATAQKKVGDWNSAVKQNGQVGKGNAVTASLVLGQVIAGGAVKVSATVVRGATAGGVKSIATTVPEKAKKAAEGATENAEKAQAVALKAADEAKAAAQQVADDSKRRKSRNDIPRYVIVTVDEPGVLTRSDIYWPDGYIDHCDSDTGVGTLLYVNSGGFNVTGACIQGGETTRGVFDGHMLSDSSTSIRVSAQWIALEGDPEDSWKARTTAQRVFSLQNLPGGHIGIGQSV